MIDVFPLTNQLLMIEQMSISGTSKAPSYSIVAVTIKKISDSFTIVPLMSNGRNISVIIDTDKDISITKNEIMNKVHIQLKHNHPLMEQFMNIDQNASKIVSQLYPKSELLQVRLQNRVNGIINGHTKYRHRLVTDDGIVGYINVDNITFDEAYDHLVQLDVIFDHVWININEGIVSFGVTAYVRSIMFDLNVDMLPKMEINYQQLHIVPFDKFNSTPVLYEGHPLTISFFTRYILQPNRSTMLLQDVGNVEILNHLLGRIKDYQIVDFLCQNDTNINKQISINYLISKSSRMTCKTMLLKEGKIFKIPSKNDNPVQHLNKFIPCRGVCNVNCYVNLYKFINPDNFTLFIKLIIQKFNQVFDKNVYASHQTNPTPPNVESITLWEIKTNNRLYCEYKTGEKTTRNIKIPFSKLGKGFKIKSLVSKFFNPTRWTLSYRITQD